MAKSWSLNITTNRSSEKANVINKSGRLFFFIFSFSKHAVDLLSCFGIQSYEHAKFQQVSHLIERNYWISYW